MWSPTHIQVTVQRAKNLLTKGKNGTNNCFVTIGLGKEKYQTSVKDKAETNVSWNEECELKIPDQGNRAELVLTCLHRNNLGIDEFLGQVTLPLNEMDVYNRPRSTWFKLESKPGKEKKNKERGELEVRISFIVKSGSLTDLSKKDKHKSSIGQLASSVGGSLLSIGTIEKRKGIKKFAKSLGSKMHLNGKKKIKEGDDVSFNGSFASIGTPNSSNGGGSRNYGQRAGEADPGVISEDEDEFVFDNLSHKSSGSSLNMRTGGGVGVGLHPPPTQNFVPRNPSPLLGVVGNSTTKKGGKQQIPISSSTNHYDVAEDIVVDPELEELEQDFSIRTRTLPAPSKPPRTPHTYGTDTTALTLTSPSSISSPKAVEKEHKLDEWEKKLYGKHLEIGSSDSLKRRSWELARVPLQPTTETAETSEANTSLTETADNATTPITTTITNTTTKNSNQNEVPIAKNKLNKVNLLQSSVLPSTDNSKLVDKKINEDEPILESEDEKEKEKVESKQDAKDQENILKPLNINNEKLTTTTPIYEQPALQRPNELKLNISPKVLPRVVNLLSPDIEKKDFNEFNASFAKFEQNNSAKIFDLDADPETKWNSTKVFLSQEAKTNISPKPLPRIREKETILMKNNKEEQEEKLKREKQEKETELKRLEEQKRRAAEDAKLEAELRQNEQRLREEELALQEELRQQEEQKRREAKRFEEDQRILNFAKRSTSMEEEPQKFVVTPEQSPKEKEKKEKRLSKFKYFTKRDKHDDDSSSSSPKSNERIIIGHEKSTTHAERRSEISAALAKKYEGKSREELMLIANGMENEALIQRQRVKELEDYLDNLLLRVMETHPKILQNPYSRTTSAKSFKNYIDMNNFL